MLYIFNVFISIALVIVIFVDPAFTRKTVVADRRKLLGRGWQRELPEDFEPSAMPPQDGLRLNYLGHAEQVRAESDVSYEQ